MSRMHWFPLTMLLGFATLVPSRASADVVLPERQCVQAFLSACATLHFIEFSNDPNNGKGVLKLIVRNSSNGFVEPNAFVYQLLFDLMGDVPEVQALAKARYGTMSGDDFIPGAANDFENWNVKKTEKVTKGLPAGFQLDLSLKDNAKTENGGTGRRLTVGDAVMFTIKFDAAFVDLGLGCDDPVDCQAWSAEMKGLGLDETGHGFTTTATPEPVTIALLATGLVGLAGAGAVRRRRRNNRSE